MKYTIYRGGKKLFAKDNLKDAQIYAKYWARKDRIPYSVVSFDGKEYIFEPPTKTLGWYIWEFGEKFKTLEEAEEFINKLGRHKKLTIYKIIEGDLLNDKYIKYKTVQAL